MKLLKSLFLKIKAKSTLRTYQKPLLVTLITLLIINFIILGIGAFVAYVLDTTYYGSQFFMGSYIKAFVTAIKWMISPNTIINYDVNSQLGMLIVAVVIVIIEMVLFSGAIIAMVTTSLRNFIDTKSKAKGKIIVSNHFVILNWNSKVPDIIYNLMQKEYKDNIVILSNQNKEYIENEVKSLFLANEVIGKSKARLIIKEGNPLLRGNLEDISIESASNIVVMAREDMADGEDDNILNSDLLNLKIVLRLGSFQIKENCQIVVETDSDITRGQIENLAFTVNSLKNKKIIPVSFNKKIGQVIAQSVVNPLLADVYLNLFSFEGAEFYSMYYQGGIEEYQRTHNQGIAVAKYEKIYVLAEDDKEMFKKREKPYQITDALIEKKNPSTDSCTIFVIGENKKSEFILDNLDRTAETTDFQYQIKKYHKNDNALLIRDIKNTQGIKKVLILSDDTVGMDSYDANVFVTLIELTKAFPKRENLTLITELLDSRNLSSVKDFDIHNTIISNRMMSLLITQLAMNRDSKKFYDKLLTVDRADSTNDFDIDVSEASEILEISNSLSFKTKAELLSKFYNCFNGKKILLGIGNEKGIQFLNRDQDKECHIEIKSSDSLIYIEY